MAETSPPRGAIEGRESPLGVVDLGGAHRHRRGRGVESLVTAARAGRRPRVVSVQTPGLTDSEDPVLQVSVDLGSNDNDNDGDARGGPGSDTLDLRIAGTAPDPLADPADAIPVMLVGTHLLSDGFLELRSADYRLVLRVDTAAIEQLLGPGPGLGEKVDASALAEMLLDSQVIEAEPVAPDGFVRHDATGLFLPTHVKLPATQTALPLVTLPELSPLPAEVAADPQARSVVQPAVEPVPHDEHRYAPLWTAAFWTAVAAVAAFRYLVLAAGGAPATIDTGNWLAFAESLFGGGSRPASVVYPPLVPVLVRSAVSVFGVVHGVAVVGALASLVPALGAYKAMGMAGLGRERIAPALLLLGAGSVGEAAAWGGFPQLIGLGLLPIGVVVAAEAFERLERGPSLRLGLVVMATLATSHFVSILMLAAVGIVAATAMLRHRNSEWFEALVGQLPWLVLPSVWLVPTYVRLVDAVVLNPNEFAALDNLTFADSLSRLDSIYGEFPGLWQVLVPLALLTPLLTWSMRHTLVWRTTTVLMTATAGLLAVTHEARYLYLVPVLVALALGVWASQLAAHWAGVAGQRDRNRYAVLAIAALVVVLQLQAGLSGFERQRDFYRVLSPGLVDAIDAADAAADAEDVIAVPSLDDAPIGWWVEGLTDAQVVYGSPLRWLNFADEVERAKTANAVFDPSFPSEASVAMLEAASVDVVIVPRAWAWFDDAALDAWVADHGFDVLERNRSAVTIALE